MDLRSHIRSSSELGLKQAGAVTTGDLGRKAEVRNLERELFVEHQVFWFQITMSESLLVHEVKTREQLVEVVAGLGFSQFASEGDEVKEFTASDELEHNKVDSLGALLRVALLTAAALDKFDDIGMLEGGKRLDLCFNKLLEGLVVVDDFDGVASAAVVSG